MRTLQEPGPQDKGILNKAISMMRGKSPQSDVEILKKKEISWQPSWIFGGHLGLTMGT